MDYSNKVFILKLIQIVSGATSYQGRSFIVQPVRVIAAQCLMSC